MITRRFQLTKYYSKKKVTVYGPCHLQSNEYKVSLYIKMVYPPKVPNPHCAACGQDQEGQLPYRRTVAIINQCYLCEDCISEVSEGEEFGADVE